MAGYKILIIGKLFDNHTIRYIRHLKSYNREVQIDVLTDDSQDKIPEDIRRIILTSVINTVYWFNPQTNRIKYLRDFEKINKLRKFINKIAQINHYDIVNIHFPSFEYAFCINSLRKLANNIVLTPWGSDVYRAGNKRLLILKTLYKNADYVCCPETRFGKDVQKVFNLKKDHIANLSMGSETTDYIIENMDKYTSSDARKLLALEGDLFITCGYNAHAAQNHMAIIDGIANFQNNYKGQVSLIFPMTYPKDKEYTDSIKEYAASKNLNAYFFTEYLDLPTLFLLRKSTDMFIHVQNTDANAGSVQEYLLLDKKVLNGEWLRYDNMEIDGKIPYTLVKDLNSISDAIQISLDEDRHISQKLRNHIKSFGWNNLIIKWDAFFNSISDRSHQ